MQPAGSGRAGAADAAFIRDGFSWLAFLLPPLWLLWHRLWIAAVLAVNALVLAAGLERATGVAAAALLVSLLVSIFVGLEGNAMRASALRRAGWRSWGVIEARRLDDAETRYAAAISSDDSTVTDEAPIQPSVNSGPASPAPGTPIGLLLNPGR